MAQIDNIFARQFRGTYAGAADFPRPRSALSTKGRLARPAAVFDDHRYSLLLLDVVLRAWQRSTRIDK